MSFAIPPAILPNSLVEFESPFPAGLDTSSFDSSRCFASLSLSLDEEGGRTARDLMELRVEWNSAVRSLGAIV